MRKSTAFLVAGLVASSALVASPAPAASPTDRVTSFLFDADSGKGLVGLTQGTGGTEFSFNFFDLRPRTKYRLIVSSKGCQSAKGTIVNRPFRTDARGSYWDPAAVPSLAAPKSARIVRALTGKTVVCSRPAVSNSRSYTKVLKVGSASPGVLVVTSSLAQWRISMSIGGLKRATTYQVVGLDGPCELSSPMVAGTLFTPNRKGAALVDVEAPPVAGKSIRSVSVLQRSNGQIVFCKTL